jgi:hypothetical protein
MVKGKAMEIWLEFSSMRNEFKRAREKNLNTNVKNNFQNPS